MYKKWIPILFAIKSSFKFPALATPNEVDRVIKDWWRMTSLQEFLKAFMFLFCSLDGCIASRTSVCLFFVEENSSPLLKQQLLNGCRDSWRDVTAHSETQTLFCTDSRSTSLGVAEAGTLRLDLRALKSQNPIFFLRIPFYTLQSFHNYKNIRNWSLTKAVTETNKCIIL